MGPAVDLELSGRLQNHNNEEFGGTYDKGDNYNGSWTNIEKEAVIYTRYLQLYYCGSEAYKALETL